MAANNENADRRVVPRWRTFREALETNELTPAALRTTEAVDGSAFVREREVAWAENKTLPFAVDLVSAATVLGSSETARRAAEAILENESETSSSAASLARALLGIEQESEGGLQNVLAQISELKKKRVSQRRNAFVWTDLARLYVMLGQNKPASRAMRVALTLAPANRFVVRCATRFLLHDRRQEEALQLLQRTERTREDPWLMAAEIAVSSVVDKPPKFARTGLQLLEASKFPPFHTSELASALASLEMFHGHDRKAKRLFRTALVDPTENALAQTIWASKRTGLEEPNLEALKDHRLNEPHALDCFNRYDWEGAAAYAEAWAQEESFSARPRLLASAVATTFLDDHTRSEKIAREGLITNPGHPGLINNIAFALNARGEPLKGLEIIDTINRDLLTPIEAICLMATVGQSYFRLGDYTQGERFYEDAIHAAFRHRNEPLRLLARIYFAREKLLSGRPDAIAEFQAACEQARELKSTNLPMIAEHFEKQLGDAERVPTDPPRHARVGSSGIE
jgi:tetratricopeptide (TPR) repeat protein